MNHSLEITYLKYSINYVDAVKSKLYLVIAYIYARESRLDVSGICAKRKKKNSFKVKITRCSKFSTLLFRCENFCKTLRSA